MRAAGTATVIQAMPPAKTLREHVRDGSFRPSRHRELLNTDHSIDGWENDRRRHRRKLFELVRFYREARFDGERHAAALAFQHALDGNWDPYTRLLPEPDDES